MAGANDYQCLGRATQFDKEREVWAAFEAEAPEVNYQGRSFPSRRSGFPNALWSVEVDGIRYIQQNPTKNTWCAQRAREGRRFIWIIRVQDNAWLGYMEDGWVYRRKS